MLRFLLLVGLFLVFIDSSCAAHKERDPRIIDIETVTERADPKPKDDHDRATKIRRQTSKTQMKVKANQRRLEVQKIAMKRRIKAGLDLVGKTLKQKGAINVNAKGKITKIDAPKVREVKNRFMDFTEMLFGSNDDKPCLHAAEFGMRAGAIANKIRGRKPKRSMQKGNKMIQNKLQTIIIVSYIYSTGAGLKNERLWTPEYIPLSEEIYADNVDCQDKDESLVCMMTWALWANEEEKEEDVLSLIDDIQSYNNVGQLNPLPMPINDEGECKEFFNEFLEDSEDDGPKFGIFTKMMTGHDIEKDEYEKLSDSEADLAGLLLEKLLGGEDKNGTGQITAWSIMIMICFAVLEFLK